MSEFDQAKVLVVGDVMMDRYWYGDTSRISPEAPVPVVRVNELEDRPGGAGNVALSLAKLGCEVRLVGVTGDDPDADVIERQLWKAGVHCDFVRDPAIKTITKLRVISHHQQLIRLDFEDWIDNSREIVIRFKSQLKGVDVVVLSDYCKGTLSDLLLTDVARMAGIPVVVDTKSKDISAYHGASLMTPNLGEFEEIVGHACTSESYMVKRGMALLEDMELGALLITRGEDGMTLIQREGVSHLPAQAKEVFDVTGAGDTVVSVMAASMAVGLPTNKAMALANTAAGIVVGKLGTSTVSAEELRGERIVMTNGCFDILHSGHVMHLNQARELGDRLIVAVNDDDSVRRLKGEGRPVNSLQERMEVLEALECVDQVISFSEDTPEKLICSILPDILVKGGDYKPEEIAGYDCVINNGGEVRTLDFKEGFSTTIIMEKIHD